MSGANGGCFNGNDETRKEARLKVNYDMPLSVKAFSRIYYQDKLEDGQEPTKAMQNTVTQMCRDGVLPARKWGKKWFIEV